MNYRIGQKFLGRSVENSKTLGTDTYLTVLGLLGLLGLFGLEQGFQGFLVTLGFRPEQPGHRGNLGRKTQHQIEQPLTEGMTNLNAAINVFLLGAIVLF
jgi:hypothetical protein